MYSDIRILVALTCIIEDEGPRNFDSHLEMRVFWIEKKCILPSNKPPLVPYVQRVWYSVNTEH